MTNHIVELLARFEFAGCAVLHIVFPTISIGLATFLTVLEGCYLKTKKQIYRDLSDYWRKIFAITFAMGIVSGLVMAFQFGSNWSNYIAKVGDITGTMLYFEATFAFMIEAIFFGLMIYGRKHLSDRMFFVSNLMVAIGTLISLWAIVTNNSWMQTPAGYKEVDGVVAAMSWLQVNFNPSEPLRVAHMLLAAYLTMAFVVISTGAYYLLRNKFVIHAKKMINLGFMFAIPLIVAQLWFGHLSGKLLNETQPLKMAAIEARWEPEQPASLVAVAWPNMETQSNDYAITLPAPLGSIIDADDANAAMPGLKEWTAKGEAIPYVPLTFWSFRVMVGMGGLMLLACLGAIYLKMKGKLYTNRLFLTGLTFMWPVGFLATVTGWLTAESGRQPWMIYNILKTTDALTPSLTLFEVIFSASVIALTYLVVYTVGLRMIFRTARTGFSFLDHKDKHNSDGSDDHHPEQKLEPQGI